MANQQQHQPSEDARTQAIMDEILLSLAAKARKEKDDDLQTVLTMTHSQPNRSVVDDDAEDVSDSKDEEPPAAGARLEKATTEDTVEYPPPAQAALVMLALLLALFLSALVSQ